MSRSADEIFELFTARKARLSPMHQAALAVRSAYYGDIYLPTPELDRNDKPLVANLLFSAGEQKSMRVASTMPDVYFPSTDPGAPRADQRGRERRMVNLAWYDENRMKIKMRKRARHMVYYASSPTMLRPDFKRKMPWWQPRNPLGTLAPEMDVGDVCPEDIIFTYEKSWSWLLKNYPAHQGDFGDLTDGTVEMLEYQDADVCVLLAVGEKTVNTARSGMHPILEKVQMCVELERSPNLVGRCTAILAGGIGLDQPRGGFDGTIGMWQAMGQMLALEAIGTKKALWPEEWLVSHPGQQAKVVTMADPLRGTIGEIADGDIKSINTQINPAGNNLINMLERYIRIDAGVPAELGGESTSNIRTGRRGDQILSSVLDFPLQEMQEILAVSLLEENKVAIAIDKAYFPSSKSIFLSATAGDITYEADKLWETDTHFVRYAHAGVDAQGLVVELGQMVGTGMMSIQTAMETHPAIEDPQAELDRMGREGLRKALLASMEQMAQDPSTAPLVAQVTLEMRSSETEIEDAVLKVHQQMQQMQAEQAQQQAQMAQPGMPPDASAQPGMAAPPGSAPIGPAPAGLTNLTGLLQSLRKGPMANVPNQLGIAS